jgi:hypothetical protein
LERLHANLHESFHFPAVTHPVGTDGFPAHFREQERVVSRPFRAVPATPRGREQILILRVKGSIDKVEVDFALDPLAELSHGDCFGFSIL